MTTETPVPPVPAAPETETAPITAGGDRLKPILAEMVASGRCTQPQADLVWWFFCYCRENALSPKQASAALALSQNSTTTISRLFRGTYGASLDSLAGRIERLKNTVEERGNANKNTFVPTSIARKVEEVCRAAWLSQSVAFVWGEPQTGKTFALEHYHRTHNHGQTKFLRIPAACNIQIAVAEIARACAVSAEGNWARVRSRILKAVDEKNLLIVDEAHQLFVTATDMQAKRVLEFIREIRDRTDCGLVLCMTNMGRDIIQSSRLAPVFKQLTHRGVVKLQLPDQAPLGDFLDIAEVAGLGAPDAGALETVRNIRVAGGIGIFCKYLQMARRLAENQDARPTWAHFQKAYDALVSLSRK